MALGDIGLRLRHRLLGRAPRPEAEAVLAERRVPQRLKPLQHRLLDHAVNHGWNAEVACPAGRLRDLHPTHRLRLVAPLQQLMFDLRPARFEDAWQLSDGDAVHAGRPLVAHHRTQRRFYVLGITDRLHQMSRLCRAFGFGYRRGHFDLLRERARGFTPARHRQVQHELDWRSRCGHETSELLALSFNPSLGTVRAFSRRGGLLRPLLTSAPWSGDLAVPSVRRDCRRKRCRSPGVSPVSFLAHPPDLQSRPLMDMDFATVSPLVRPLLPRIRFLFVGSRFRSTLPSDGPSRFRPCASLVLPLHQAAQGTFTPRTLGMPSTLTLRAAYGGALWASWTAAARGGVGACRSGRQAGRLDRTTGWWSAIVVYGREPAAYGQVVRVDVYDVAGVPWSGSNTARL